MSSDSDTDLPKSKNQDDKSRIKMEIQNHNSICAPEIFEVIDDEPRDPPILKVKKPGDTSKSTSFPVLQGGILEIMKRVNPLVADGNRQFLKKTGTILSKTQALQELLDRVYQTTKQAI
jgi:hypothetical protein